MEGNTRRILSEGFFAFKKGNKSHGIEETDSCTPMFIATLFITVQYMDTTWIFVNKWLIKENVTWMYVCAFNDLALFIFKKQNCCLLQKYRHIQGHYANRFKPSTGKEIVHYSIVWRKVELTDPGRRRLSTMGYGVGKWEKF